MIATLMIYCFSVAALIGVAAFAIERATDLLGWPRRAIWMAGLIASLGIPIVMIATAEPRPATSIAMSTMIDDTVSNSERLTIAAAPESFTATSVAAKSTFSHLPIATILPSVWLATSCGLLLFLLSSWIRLRNAARLWKTEVIDGTAVRISENSGPAVVGFFKPEIVVPRWLLSAPAADRTTAIAHEREHIAAGDQYLLLSALLLIALMPWNLPLWWQLRHLRFAIEVDCDQRVLGSGTEVATYGEMLLAVSQHNSSIPMGAIAMTAPASQLEQRIRIMTRSTFRYAKPMIAASLLVSIAFVAVAAQLDAPPFFSIVPLRHMTNAKPVATTTTVSPPDATVPPAPDVEAVSVSSAENSVEPVQEIQSTSNRVAVTPNGKSTRTRLAQGIKLDAGRSTTTDENATAALDSSQKVFTLEFDDIDIRIVLKSLSDSAGGNLIVSDKVAGNISARLIHASWQQALDYVVKEAGLVQRRVGNIIFIEPRSAQAPADAQPNSQSDGKIVWTDAAASQSPVQYTAGSFSFHSDSISQEGILYNVVAQRRVGDHIEYAVAQRAEIYTNAKQQQVLVMYDGQHYQEGPNSNGTRYGFTQLAVVTEKHKEGSNDSAVNEKSKSATEVESAKSTDHPAKRIKFVQPERPDGLLPSDTALHWVEVSFTIAADGSIKNAEVHASQPDGRLDEAALTSVRQWLYEPATKDGQAIDTRTIVRLRF